MSIVGLVLAAGGSRRYGGPKLVEPLAGEPVIRRVVQSVLDAGLEAMVVVRPGAGAVRAALAGLPVAFVENDEADEGMGRSIGRGVCSLPQSAEAVLILLADQPTTTPDLIRRLCGVHRETGATAVAPSYRGVQGPPVLFSRGLFAELEALEGDRGARSVLEKRAGSAVVVPVDEPVPRDIDTVADHAALEALLNRPS